MFNLKKLASTVVVAVAGLGAAAAIAVPASASTGIVGPGVPITGIHHPGLRPGLGLRPGPGLGGGLGFGGCSTCATTLPSYPIGIGDGGCRVAASAAASGSVRRSTSRRSPGTGSHRRPCATWAAAAWEFPPSRRSCTSTASPGCARTRRAVCRSPASTASAAMACGTGSASAASARPVTKRRAVSSLHTHHLLAARFHARGGLRCSGCWPGYWPGCSAAPATGDAAATSAAHPWSHARHAAGGSAKGVHVCLTGSYLCGGGAIGRTPLGPSTCVVR